MAKEILGLEVSSTELRYASVKRKQSNIIVSKCGKISLPEPTAIKTPENLKSFIQEILSKENISPDRICLSIHSSELLVHQINLPKMPDKELNEVIKTEIERIPRFANKEFDYIYSASKIGEQRLRVLFCALAKDTLDNYIPGIQSTGIVLDSLEISPLNLLEVLYSRIEKAKSEALVVLDSHSSSMTVFSKNECRFFFQLTSGKEDLYSASQINKTTFLGWLEEIKRISRSYEREFGGQAVDKIWLIWDSENCEELGELMGKELGLEVAQLKLEEFNIELEDREASFNPIFLLPIAGPLVDLRGLRQRINFDHFLRQLKLKEAIKNTGILTGIFMLLAGIFTGLLTLGINSANRSILNKESDIDEHIAVLEQETSILRGDRNEYMDIRDRLLRQATFVSMLNRTSWSEVFAKVSALIPTDVSLASLTISESMQIEIKGATFSIDSVANLIRKIEESSFLENPQFDSLSEMQVEDKRIVNFALNTGIKIKPNEE